MRSSQSFKSKIEVCDVDFCCSKLVIMNENSGIHCRTVDINTSLFVTAENNGHVVASDFIQNPKMLISS